MSFSAVDYIAVLGPGPGPLKCDPFRNIWSDAKEVITATELLNEAITDMAVISGGLSTFYVLFCVF